MNPARIYDRVNERVPEPLDFRPSPTPIPQSVFTDRPSIRQTAFTLNTYDPEGWHPEVQRLQLNMGAFVPRGRLTAFAPPVATYRPGAPAPFAAGVPSIVDVGSRLPNLPMIADLPAELPDMGGWL